MADLIPTQLRGTQFDCINPIQALSPLTDSTVKVAIGASNAVSDAISANVVRLVATVACYVQFGSSPVATNAKMYLPANSPEYFQFRSGDKIGVIQDTGGGSLFITPAA